MGVTHTRLNETSGKRDGNSRKIVWPRGGYGMDEAGVSLSIGEIVRQIDREDRSV